MNSISYLALAISPGIALVIYIYLVLMNNKKFGWLLIKSFIAGALSSSLMILVVYLTKRTGLDIFSDLINTLIYSFFVVGFCAELGKYIVLKGFILSSPEVSTPVKGIIFSVMTSLGFSTIIAILFYFNLFDANPPYPANMYILLVGPSNIVFGVILGFFLGMLKFVESRWIYNFAGIVSASFFAGLFCFCLITKDYKLLSLFSFGSSIVVMVLIMRSIYFRP
jgi:RsiW-degrading membrane proteinase PrsW (M82 family)